MALVLFKLAWCAVNQAAMNAGADQLWGSRITKHQRYPMINRRSRINHLFFKLSKGSPVIQLLQATQANKAIAISVIQPNSQTMFLFPSSQQNDFVAVVAGVSLIWEIYKQIKIT